MDPSEERNISESGSGSGAGIEVDPDPAKCSGSGSETLLITYYIMVKCPNSVTNNSTNNPLVSINQVPAI